MRKATIIFILVAFIGSIMIVNFFGLKIKVYNEYKYVKKIEVSEESIKCSPGVKMTSFSVNNKNVITINVDYELDYKERTGKDQFIMIIPRCLPDNANDKKVEASYTGVEKEYYICDNENPVPTIMYNYTPEKIDKINSRTSKKEAITVYLLNKRAGDSVKRTVNIVTHLVDKIENE